MFGNAMPRLYGGGRYTRSGRTKPFASRAKCKQSRKHKTSCNLLQSRRGYSNSKSVPIMPQVSRYSISTGSALLYIPSLSRRKDKYIIYCNTVISRYIWFISKYCNISKRKGKEKQPGYQAVNCPFCAYSSGSAVRTRSLASSASRLSNGVFGVTTTCVSSRIPNAFLPMNIHEAGLHFPFCP